jgi:hypothetical protein
MGTTLKSFMRVGIGECFMLYFIAIWCILAFTCGILGTAVVSLTCNWQRLGDRGFLAQWLGLVIFSLLLLAISLFLPLSPGVGIGVAGAACGLALCYPPTRMHLLQYKRAIRLGHLLAGGCGLVAIAALMTQRVIWNDTGLYHYSNIQWLAQAGTVPGIALLFDNFGFTSSWFALAAPLNPEILGSRVSAVTNGFVYWLALCQVGSVLSQVWQKKAKLSDSFIGYFLAIILLLTLSLKDLRQIYISPTPDLPIIILVGVVAWTILVGEEENTYSRSQQRRVSSVTVPLVLSLGTVCIKLTALPLLGVCSLLFLVHRKFHIRSIVYVVGLTALMLSPFLVASIMTSGCPLYPSSLMCVALPWSPAPEKIQATVSKTHQWTSWYGEPPPGANAWLWSLRRWLAAESANRIMATSIVVDAIISPYPLTLAWRRRSPALAWLILLAATGIGFVMWKAPFTRFALPYILIVPVLAIALLEQKVASFGIRQGLLKMNLISSRGRRSLLQAGCLSLVVALLIQQGASGKLFLPPSMPSVPFERRQVNDVIYNLPTKPKRGKALCWSTPIPCATKVPDDIKLRNPAGGIADGFVRQQ